MKSTPRGPRNMDLALFLHTPDAPEELFWGKKSNCTSIPPSRRRQLHAIYFRDLRGDTACKSPN